MVDLEAKLYMYVLRLQEDKKYLTEECEYSIIYVF